MVFISSVIQLALAVAALTTIDPAGARHSSSELGSALAVAALQRCSVAVLKTRFTRMSGKAEAQTDSKIVKN